MHTFAVTSVISIDHITQPNASERITVGSCGFYTALALSKLGADVLYAGIHGNDFDHHRLDILRHANAAVETCQLAGNTARLDLTYDMHGNIASVHYDEGIGTTVTAANLPHSFWESRILWIGTSPFAFQLEVARRAAPQQQVCLSPQGEWKGRALDVILIIPHLSYLMINQRELTDLGFGDLPTTLDTLYAANPELQLLITRSKHGGWLITPDRLYAVPSVPDPIIADTTGAGDTFNAAFALRTSTSASPAQALQWATAAAALSMRDYAYFALPTASEVDASLDPILSKLPVEEIPRASSRFIELITSDI